MVCGIPDFRRQHEDVKNRGLFPNIYWCIYSGSIPDNVFFTINIPLYILLCREQHNDAIIVDISIVFCIDLKEHLCVIGVIRNIIK